MVKSKHILRMEYPSITSLPSISNIFAVLENRDSADEWIYSNYIQLMSYKGTVNKDITFLHSTFGFQHCPFLEIGRMTRKHISSMTPSYKDFITKTISSDIYLLTAVNQKFLTGATANINNRDLYHPSAIYGYDLEKDLVYMADFTFEGTGKYTFKTFSFDDVEKSLSDKNIQEEDFYIVRYKKVDFMFDMNNVKRQFEDLYNSVNTYDRLDVFNEYMAMNKFGMDVYDDYINMLENWENWILRKVTFCLLDHKKLMVQRLEYMVKKRFLKDDGIISDYREIHNMVNKILMLSIKASAGGKNSSEECIRIANDVREKERTVLGKIIKELNAQMKMLEMLEVLDLSNTRTEYDVDIKLQEYIIGSLIFIPLLESAVSSNAGKRAAPE